MEITAAVLRATDGSYELEQVQLADPGPHEVLVRVVSAGMCHTDVVPRSLELVLPIITGHEGAGIVESVGSAVNGVEVGDHVVLSFDSCGTCASCSRGVPAYCETFITRNLTGRDVDWGTTVADGDGAEVSARWFGQSSFATHCIATARNVVVVDRDAPLELLGPLGCGILTGAGSVLVALDVQAGRSIVIFGAGAVGLAAVMAATIAGATTIIAVDLHEHRLELARELGATHALDGSSEGLLEEIAAITAGGADYSFDTTGNTTVMANAIGAIRLGGHCGFVGIQTEPLTLDPLALIGKNVSGILEGGADPQVLVPRLIELWREGRFPFDRLIETFPLSAINDAEAASLAGKVVKPVLLPAPVVAEAPA
ncbi:NAD(P)-dependent alcohol dehydrogenase [Aquihabitans sp. McL0605]|uniref:NAD(P)-dependent alcohol dehydrogenase n=1 Tax=Aquihabitans sp. McL0605 TaxID=3415671 RepID=UPI003CEDB0ED